MSGGGEKLGSFEINDFKWGISAVKKESTKASKGSGTQESGEEASMHRVVRVPSFKISKPFDSASAALFSACLDIDGVFPEAFVLFRKTSASGPFVYLKFIFRKVQVDSVDWSIKPIDQSDAKPDQEDVAFSFESCDIFYSPQTRAGQKESTWNESKKSASFSRTKDMESE
jgi:type VI protein secretion system component Hcp